MSTSPKVFSLSVDYITTVDIIPEVHVKYVNLAWHESYRQAKPALVTLQMSNI